MAIFQWLSIVIASLFLLLVNFNAIKQAMLYYWDLFDIFLVVMSLITFVGLCISIYTTFPFTITLNQG